VRSHDAKRDGYAPQSVAHFISQEKKMPLRSSLLLILLAVGLAFVPGCGSRTSEDPTILNQRNDLTEIYDMYNIYMKKNERPPQQASDLLQKPDQVHSAGMRALKNNDYLVVWGVDVKKNSGAVLAYEKAALEQGGTVLMADGDIRKMSAEELKAALPAGK
jgi:hypothetical protein